eukprot:SAG11_NODE_389_length_9870_cov_7.646812_10_plen_59_part_00
MLLIVRGDERTHEIVGVAMPPSAALHGANCRGQELVVARQPRAPRRRTIKKWHAYNTY